MTSLGPPPPILVALMDSFSKNWDFLTEASLIVSNQTVSHTRYMYFVAHSMLILWQALTTVIQCTNTILDRTCSIKIPPVNLLELCRILFQCAAHTTSQSQAIPQGDFLNLTARIARHLSNLSSLDTNWSEAFACQCMLDMAMRLQGQIPGIIHNSFFAEIHIRSIRIFDLCLKWNGWMPRYLRGWDDEPHAQGEKFGEPDWKGVLRLGRRGYISVDVRGPREYGDICWDYATSRVSCKHRIEFILNYRASKDDPWHAGELRRIFARSQF